MKILLSTLNSKYIHSNLAIRYLKSYCNGFDIEISEFTINDNTGSITNNIYSRNPDIIGFSCYIWNIEQTLKAASTIKSANPNIKIIFGGPEVSYNPQEFMNENPWVDFVVFGEGEETFKKLIESLESDKENFDIDGLAYRKGERVTVNNPRELIKNLDNLKFPYDNLEGLQNKIVYYEASRGCPFNCQYCLSSTFHGVRYFSLDRVKSDLTKLIEAGVSQVKFVDRTFNCEKKRTLEIFRFLLKKNPQNINFHFEIGAELLDDEILELLKEIPQGLFQFEMGVQSTNKETLDIICRKSDFDKLGSAVNKINSYKNIHLHLDLIAGLPKEDYETFKKSFNHVYNLKPQMLQLGFLKLLKGSGLREKAEQYGIKYNKYTPYEVICTNDLSFMELIKLKNIEEILEKYYNSGRFKKCLNYIDSLNKNAFDFYEEFADYWVNKGLFSLSHNVKELYTILVEFYEYKKIKEIELVKDLLKFDYLSNEQNSILPRGLERKIELKEETFEFLKKEANVEKYIPKYKGIPAKQIVKKSHIEEFEYDVYESYKRVKTYILFDYDVKNKTFSPCYVYNISKELKMDNKNRL